MGNIPGARSDLLRPSHGVCAHFQAAQIGEEVDRRDAGVRWGVVCRAGVTCSGWVPQGAFRRRGRVCFAAFRDGFPADFVRLELRDGVS